MRHGLKRDQQAGPAGLRAQDRDPPRAGRPGHRHPLHVARRHDRAAGPAAESRRRGPLLRLVGASHVAYRSKPDPGAAGVKVTSTAQHVTRHRAEGHAEARRPSRDARSTARTARCASARPSDAAAHRALHGLTRTLLANMVVGVNDGFTKSLELRASATAPSCRVREPRPGGRLLAPGRDPAQRASPSPSRRHPADAWSAPTRSSSARSRPTSARAASPSRTRARASATRARGPAQGRQGRQGRDGDA